MSNSVFITYRHLRRDTDTSNEGGVTLAIKVDLRDPNDRHMVFGYALCNPEYDTFNRKVGREVAYAHLRANIRHNKEFGWDLENVVPYTDKSEGTIVEQILEHVENTREDYRVLSRYLDRHVY